MPIYNYQCTQCSHVWEMNKKISERDETATEVCPECSTTGQINRMVSAPLIGYSVTVAGGYG